MLDKAMGKAKNFVQSRPEDVLTGAALLGFGFACYALGRYHATTTIQFFVKPNPSAAFEHIGSYPVK